MPTVEQINEAFESAGKQFAQDLRKRLEAQYGPMSDAAIGLMAHVGFGGSVLLPDGTKVDPIDMAICLQMGETPDSLLKLMREASCL